MRSLPHKGDKEGFQLSSPRSQDGSLSVGPEAPEVPRCAGVGPYWVLVRLGDIVSNLQVCDVDTCSHAGNPRTSLQL